MLKKLPDNVEYHRKDMFKLAFSGLKTAFIEEKNLQFDVMMGIIVIVCGTIFQVTKSEWCFLLFAICQVLVAELVNTLVENIVDLIMPTYNEKAKKIKDISCGMVLTVCIFSAVVGLIIFVPYILK